MPVPQLILDGRYQLLRQIGQGGFSRAHLAWDLRLERHVVAKILHRELSDDPAMRQRFEREARIAASVSGPNIVDIYDYGTADGRPIIISQWIDGVDLSRVIRPGTGLRVSDSLEIMDDVLGGLQTLHRAGIQHRDIKPQNILLPKWNAPAKLTDFGISRSEGDPRLTAPGVILGSPGYMSPEQIDGRDLSFATDIYSATIVLFELLTGRLPFEGESASEIRKQHRLSPPPLPRQINSDIPPALENVILKGLAKQPEQRFANADEMAEALKGIGMNESAGGDVGKERGTNHNARTVPVPREEQVTVVNNMAASAVPQNRHIVAGGGRKRGFNRERKKTPFRGPQGKPASKKRRSWFRRRMRRIPRYPLIVMIIVVVTVSLLALTQGIG